MTRRDRSASVLVNAGPQQATSWRDASWKSSLPDLIFATDRSWLFSTVRTCIGGPDTLIDSFLDHPELGARARRVVPGENAV